MVPWCPPNNDRIACYDEQIISGSRPAGAPVQPVDDERCQDNEQCAHKDGRDDGEKR